MACFSNLGIILLALPLLAFCEIDMHVLKSWYSKVKDPKYDCPSPSMDEGLSDFYIVQTAPCEDPQAIFTYDYKVTLGIMLTCLKFTLFACRYLEAKSQRQRGDLSMGLVFYCLAIMEQKKK